MQGEEREQWKEAIELAIDVEISEASTQALLRSFTYLTGTSFAGLRLGTKLAGL